jgi:ABC-type branched-subunit amino acid transport system ATPase component
MIQPPRSAGADVALTVTGLSVDYGAVRAVNDVSLTLRTGTLTGLIGPNGAGKTSLLDGLCGFAAARGSVCLAGRALDGMAPHARQRAGLSRTFQSMELFDDLSVEENLAVYRHTSPRQICLEILRGRRLAGDERLDSIIEEFELGELRNTPVGSLSQGHRKIVTIARALAAEPTVLLLDEPAAGLDSSESRWLRDHLTRIAASGVTLLLVEHDLDLVLSACDELYVLDFGVVIAHGPPEDVIRQPAVVSAYLGAAVARPGVAGTQ